MMDNPTENTMDDLRERLAEVVREYERACVYAPNTLVSEFLNSISLTHTITPIREPVHGTIYTYTRKKCRCDECRAANAAYSREYRAGLRREAGKNG